MYKVDSFRTTPNKGQQGRKKLMLESQAGHVFQQVKQEKDTTVNKYDEQSLHYVNERFNEKIQNALNNISIIAYRGQKSFIRQYPVLKILTFLSKKLFLNGLQLIFLEYILKQSKWALDDKVIQDNVHYVTDFMNNTDVSNVVEYKQVLFYLTLISYSAKYYLNDQATMQIFTDQLQRMITGFNSHFTQWSKNNTAITSKISPKELNKIFKLLNSREHYQNPSYYIMVEHIIDISPPYNNSQAEKKVKRKERGPTQHQEVGRVHQIKANINEEDFEQRGVKQLNEFQSYNNRGDVHEEEQLPNLQIRRQNTSLNDGVGDVIQRNLKKDKMNQ